MKFATQLSALRNVRAALLDEMTKNGSATLDEASTRAWVQAAIAETGAA